MKRTLYQINRRSREDKHTRSLILLEQCFIHDRRKVFVVRETMAFSRKNALTSSNLDFNE